MRTFVMKELRNYVKYLLSETFDIVIMFINFLFTWKMDNMLPFD